MTDGLDMCLLTSRGLGLELFLPWLITVRQCDWTGDFAWNFPDLKMACWEQLQLVPQVLKLLHEDVVASLMPQAAH